MANSVDLVIGSEAIRQVENLTDKLKLADIQILKISQNALLAGRSLSGIQLPSDLAQFTSENQRLTTQIQAQSQALAQLQTQYNTLAQRRQQSSQRTAEESVNQGVLNRNALESARINSTLAGAYSRLSTQQSQSSRNLQDLTVRGRLATQTQREYDRELRVANNEFNTLNQRVLAADRAVGRFNRNVGNYPSQAVKGIRDLLGAFGVVGGLSMVASIATNIFETTKEIQSLNMALKQVTGTNELFGRSQEFLGRISDDYGADINSLTKQFTQFYVSAKDKISGREIEGIFESITKAGASMGLSQQQQEKAFLALNQMMSKGTIQAEELRGQLGEALPGALGVMAKSLGVTESQLGKMMKNGELLASEVLPKFAKQLEITYGIENVKRIENLTTAQNRLSNAWKSFVSGLNDDGNKLSSFFSGALKVVTKIVEGTTLLLQSEETKRKNTLSAIRQQGYSETLSYYKSLDNLKKEDLQLDKDYNEQKIKNETAEFNRLKGRNLILQAIKPELKFGMNKEDQARLVSTEAELKQNKEKMISINNLLSLRVGNLNAIKQLLQEEKKVVQKAQEKGGVVKAKKEEVEALRGTEKWYNQQIAKLKELQVTTADTTDEYKDFTSQIELLLTALEKLKKGDPFKKPSLEDTSNEAINIPVIEEKDGTDPNQWLEDYKKDSDIWDGHEQLKSDWKETFNSIADSAKQAGDIISEFSQRNFDNEYARLEAQKDISLKFAGDSAEAKAKIEADYEKKRNEIANRENKAKQKQAIFNIAIDTAQAIMATVGKTGFAGLPLALILGGLGAAQIALVASQKIPQYFDGTDNHIGGMMIVNDGAGANFQEKVILPNGKEIIPEGRNVLMNAPKGTKVLTHEQQIMQMLNEKGISMSAKYSQNNGMTAQEMDGVLGKHFAKIQTNNTTFDRNGFRSWSESNGNRTIQNNNRVSRTGFNV